MTLSATLTNGLNRMNEYARRAGLGTLLAGLEGGSAGMLRKATITVAKSAFTDGLAAVGTYSTGVTIPAKATFLYTAVEAVTAFSGDTSAVLIAGDGTDTDRYNTGTLNVFATAAGGVAAGDPSGVKYHAVAKEIVLTVTSAADFTNVAAGGSVTISFFWLV